MLRICVLQSYACLPRDLHRTDLIINILKISSVRTISWNDILIVFSLFIYYAVSLENLLDGQVFCIKPPSPIQPISMYSVSPGRTETGLGHIVVILDKVTPVSAVNNLVIFHFWLSPSFPSNYSVTA